MTRFLATSAVLLFAALASTGSHATGATLPPRLVEAGSTFPERAYVLTLPSRKALTPGQVRITENGDPVVGLRVTPVGSSGERGVGTVLLIDASNSMRGKPITAAIAAAREFSARRNVNQPLAVVAFNDRASVLAPFTTNGAEIDTALQQTPTLREGTHIFDALARAISLVQDADLSAASFVLLSDGADVGSRLDGDEIEKQLTDEHVRVFSIGLRSGAFNPSSLTRLGVATKGGYIESSTTNLNRVYAALGYQLANEYFVRYLSQAGASRRITVHVSVAGFRPQTTGYRSPALETSSIALKPYKRSTVSQIIQSGVTGVIVGLMIIALFGLAVWIAVRKPDQTLPERLSQFVHIPTEQEARERRQEIAGALAQKTGRSFRELQWWRRFSEDVELAEIGIAPEAIALWATAIGVLSGLILTLLLHSAVWLLLLGAGPLCARMFVTYKLKKKRARFAEQLPDNLEVLASALRAGHSLVGGLAVVVDDPPEPSKKEFQRVVADEQLGIPLEDSLSVVVRRMDNQDLDQVALVASLQRDTGGNAAEVLDQVVLNIRGRMELRRLVQTLTAQGRMARWIVSLLPAFLLLAIMVINPDYADPLWHRTVGQIALVLATLLVITGSLVIRRIVDIKV